MAITVWSPLVHFSQHPKRQAQYQVARLDQQINQLNKKILDVERCGFNREYLLAKIQDSRGKYNKIQKQIPGIKKDLDLGNYQKIRRTLDDEFELNGSGARITLLNVIGQEIKGLDNLLNYCDR